jgi:putative hydrolase of the HAD superfamily
MEKSKDMFTDIRAISLDAMGTLIGLRRSAADIYFEVLRGLGHDAEKISRLLKEKGIFRRYWKEAGKRLPPGFIEERVDRFHHLKEYPFAFWGLIFQVMFEDLQLDGKDLFPAVEAAYQRFTDPNLWGIEPTFRNLVNFSRERNIRLFVTSNWDFRLPSILKGLGIDTCFGQIITSALVGFEKPSAKIFQYLVSAAQCNPEQILHVGDRLEDDFKGAQEAGLKTVLYGNNRQEDQRNPSIPQVDSLIKLIGLLD